ncbi:9620_t:CDS:2 [Gigaspora rosea]|nr:9620_t:CDS:2 [Gigaspora rosea]
MKNKPKLYGNCLVLFDVVANNPYITTISNETNNANNSERDLTDPDLVMSDKENLEDLIEAEKHKGKDIETVKSSNLATPLEDKLTNELEVNRIEEVSEIANSEDTELEATANTKTDDEGFIEVSYDQI